jgi:CRP-like cAMP-binding protein
MHRPNRLDPLAKSLAETPAFSHCTRRELSAICPYATEINIKAGRVLTREGEVGMELFVVLAGRARVERSGVTLAVANAGSIVGEIALLRNTPRTATVTAITDMTVVVISRAELAAIRHLGVVASLWGHLDCLIEERLKTVNASSHFVAPCALEQVLAGRPSPCLVQT